jgi:hypothetical protein
VLTIAVLSKRAGFWYVGLACCLAGTLVALSGWFNLFMSPKH